MNYIIVCLLLSFGLYLIVTEKMRLPSSASIRATLRIMKGKQSTREILVYPAAQKITRFIHLSENKRNEMKQQLKAASNGLSPELFIASAIVNALYIIIVSLALLPVLPLGTIILILLAVYSIFKELKSLNDAVNKRRTIIENEVQQFVSAINLSLGRRQDLYNVIKSYRKVAGKELGEELDVLLTDMRTSNREDALLRFESRINSRLVSEVVRGLINVCRGNDMSAYLCAVEMHARDFKIANLKKEAEKRPEKLTAASFLLFGAMLAMLAAVIIAECLKGGNIFHF
ncbi:MAG TPA: hypothetical protein VHO66_08625 [Ruminiclostridium sp.]|nr:hypothetical protein [Ruminiclostridium sp.]